jgi:DNA polymerase I-like protein with 3'-5' exonuclease and polymerase domains
LQGAAATVAKMWCVNFENFCEDDGLYNGWGSNEEPGDFAILAWIHDELQVAVRDDAIIMETARRNIIDAAISAGERLSFRAPVDVDVKWGQRWADTH